MTEEARGVGVSPQSIEVDQHASVLVRHGISLLNENNDASLTEAIRCFDEAIELRRSLPLDGNPWISYNLAAGWLNRGDAMTRLGSPENLREAIRSFDEALVVLRHLPPGDHPLFRKRHVIAWMNRGIALQAQEVDIAEAMNSFDNAIAVLTESSATEMTDRALLLACAWMNRGNACLRSVPAQPTEAHDSAMRAVELIRDIENDDAVAAETGFQARHVMCQAIAEMLSEKPKHEQHTNDLFAAATDAVEDAMRFARHWEARGERRFRPLVNALFRFGAQAYRMHQPHFLGEFLLENLDPVRSPNAIQHSPEMHEIAAEALLDAQLDTRSLPRDFSSLREKLRELRQVTNRLAELRQHCS